MDVSVGGVLGSPVAVEPLWRRDTLMANEHRDLTVGDTGELGGMHCTLGCTGAGSKGALLEGSK